MAHSFTPRSLFLVDAIGASVTAGVLYFVIHPMPEVFGTLGQMIPYLAGMACMFSVYSLLCYFFITHNWEGRMRLIAYANLVYCAITSALMVSYHAHLLYPGWAYFLSEVMIITLLARFELAMVKG